MEDNKATNQNCLQCQDCGKQDETVERGICPYENIVCNTKLPITICEDCYQNRLDEV